MMKRFLLNNGLVWVGLTVILLVIVTTSILIAPPPHIETSNGETIVNISADKSWLIAPGACTTITWQIEGISALYVDGEGKIGADSMDYCPVVNAPSPLFEVVDTNGITRSYRILIHYLLDEILYALSFAGIAFAFCAVIYYLIHPDLSQRPPLAFSVFLLVALSLTVGLLRHTASPAPLLDTQEGDTIVYLKADVSRAFFPEECIPLTWHVLNAEQVTINGVEQALQGTSQHCQPDGDRAILEISRSEGSPLTYELPLQFTFPHLDNTSWYAVLSLISLIACAGIYLPLAFQISRKAWQSGNRYDFIVAGSLLLLAIILYLPFGWSHVGHWEEWVIKAYIEGMPNDWLDNELRTRLFVIVPHTLAHILTPNSFAGYNLIHTLMFFGKSLFLYAILRKLHLPLLTAFFISALFMVYPVNSAIMSLRSFPMQFSAVSLLGAGYLILYLRENPSRLAMAGIWLALLFSVGANESGYLIILIAPLFWLALERGPNWKVLNLTAIWYMMPAVRGAFTFGLLATGRGFYLSGDLDSMAGTPLDRLQPILRALGNTYQLTYPAGWQEAFSTLSTRHFLLPSIIGAGLIVVTGWYLYQYESTRLTLRQTIALIGAGLIFMIPAVGVMISLDFYRNDTWRVFFYAPISGAVVIVGLIVLVTDRIPADNIRKYGYLIIIGLLCIPAFNRALNQHSYFVDQAIAKEGFLRALVEQAPAYDPATQFIVISDIALADLPPTGLHEFVRRDMFASALYLLYDHQPPQYVYLCVMDDSCTTDDDHLTVIFPYREIPYSELVVFHLKSDLSVTRIDSLDRLSSFPDDIADYQPQQWILNTANPSPRLAILP